MTSSQCPRCHERVRLAEGPFPDDAYAECPWCRETYPIYEVLERLPPQLNVFSADGSPLTHSKARMLAGAEAAFAAEEAEFTGVDDVDSPENWDDDDSPERTSQFSAYDTVADLSDRGSPSPQPQASVAGEGGWNDAVSAKPVQPVSPMKVMPVPTRKKKGSGLRTFVGIVLGGLLALPAAGVLLMLAGRTPDLGFWPFLGEDHTPNDVIAAPPADLSSRSGESGFQGRSLTSPLANASATDDAEPDAWARERIRPLTDADADAAGGNDLQAARPESAADTARTSLTDPVDPPPTVARSGESPSGDERRGRASVADPSSDERPSHGLADAAVPGDGPAPTMTVPPEESLSSDSAGDVSRGEGPTGAKGSIATDTRPAREAKRDSVEPLIAMPDSPTEERSRAAEASDETSSLEFPVMLESSISVPDEVESDASNSWDTAAEIRRDLTPPDDTLVDSPDRVETAAASDASLRAPPNANDLQRKVDRIGMMLDSMATFQGAENERLRRLLRTCEEIGEAIELAASEKEPEQEQVLERLVDRIKESAIVDELELMGPEFLLYKRRQADALLLIGRPATSGGDQTLELTAGRQVRIDGESELPPAEKVAVLCRVLDDGTDPLVDVVYADAFP